MPNPHSCGLLILLLAGLRKLIDLNYFLVLLCNEPWLLALFMLALASGCVLSRWCGQKVEVANVFGIHFMNDLWLFLLLQVSSTGRGYLVSRMFMYYLFYLWRHKLKKLLHIYSLILMLSYAGSVDLPLLLGMFNYIWQLLIIL